MALGEGLWQGVALGPFQRGMHSGMYGIAD